MHVRNEIRHQLATKNLKAASSISYHLNQKNKKNKGFFILRRTNCQTFFLDCEFGIWSFEYGVIHIFSSAWHPPGGKTYVTESTLNSIVLQTQLTILSYDIFASVHPFLSHSFIMDCLNLRKKNLNTRVLIWTAYARTYLELAFQHIILISSGYPRAQIIKLKLFSYGGKWWKGQKSEWDLI